MKELLQRIQSKTFAARYFGVPAVKNPCDFWAYQEIVWDTRPGVIVEIGNYCGGTLLAFAHMLDHIGVGRVIGCDIDHSTIHPSVHQHPRISLVTGDAVSRADQVTALCDGADRVLVVEDSSHDYANTLAVLRAYRHLVRPGQYFVVEDGICHHGIDEGPEPGPYEAVETFLREDGGFERDQSREWPVTWNPGGFLRRVA